MLYHLELGPFQLADYLSRTSAIINWKGTDPFQLPRADLGRLVNILNSISIPLAKMMIEGRLHEVFRMQSREGLRLVKDNAIEDPERLGVPGIYALVHCTKEGRTPTANEYLQAINIMEDYIAQPQNSNSWARLDAIAKEIDEGHVPERDWSRGAKGEARKQWTHKNNVPKLHPRRYYTNESARGQIRSAIVALKACLLKIDTSKRDQPLDWSLVYVGWTPRDDRINEHNSHYGTGTAVKWLIEAVMAIKVQTPCRYFMYEVTLVPVLHPDDIGIAEHLCSFLCGSYARWGRLNGTVAGGGGISTKEKKRKDADSLWINAATQVKRQGIFTKASKELNEDMADRKLLERWKEEGLELAKYDEELEMVGIIAKDQDDATRATVGLYSTLVAAKKERQAFTIKTLEMLEDHQILDSLDLDL
jgi:hypothetical protein